MSGLWVSNTSCTIRLLILIPRVLSQAVINDFKFSTALCRNWFAVSGPSNLWRSVVCSKSTSFGNEKETSWQQNLKNLQGSGNKLSVELLPRILIINTGTSEDKGGVVTKNLATRCNRISPNGDIHPTFSQPALILLFV